MEAENILVALTPPEFYVWGWLSGLALDRGTRNIYLPHGTPAFYTKRHLRKILKSLQEKKYLLIITTPKNQSESMLVHLGASRPLMGCRSVTQDRAPGPTGPTEGEKGEIWGSARSPRTDRAQGENPSGPGPGDRRPVTQDRPATQLAIALKTKEKLEAFVGMEQRELLGRIKVMDWETEEKLLQRVGEIAPIARAGSRKAKLFAGIRYLQERATVKHPRAFVEALAKRTQEQLKGGAGWKDGLSGGGGKSQFREASGGS